MRRERVIEMIFLGARVMVERLKQIQESGFSLFISYFGFVPNDSSVFIILEEFYSYFDIGFP